MTKATTATATEFRTQTESGDADRDQSTYVPPAQYTMFMPDELPRPDDLAAQYPRMIPDVGGEVPRLTGIAVYHKRYGWYGSDGDCGSGIIVYPDLIEAVFQTVDGITRDEHDDMIYVPIIAGGKSLASENEPSVAITEQRPAEPVTIQPRMADAPSPTQASHTVRGYVVTDYWTGEPVMPEIWGPTPIFAADLDRAKKMLAEESESQAKPLGIRECTIIIGQPVAVDIPRTAHASTPSQPQRGTAMSYADAERMVLYNALTNASSGDFPQRRPGGYVGLLGAMMTVNGDTACIEQHPDGRVTINGDHRISERAEQTLIDLLNAGYIEWDADNYARVTRAGAEAFAAHYCATYCKGDDAIHVAGSINADAASEPDAQAVAESPALLLNKALAWAPAGDNPKSDLENYDQVLGLLMSIPASQLSVNVSPPADTLRGYQRVTIEDTQVEPIELNSRQVQSLVDLEAAGYLSVRPHPATPKTTYVYVTPAGIEAFAMHMRSGNAKDASVALSA